MTTRRLLWGMTWRGTVWGLLAGIVEGVVYGALIGNVLLFSGLLAQTPFSLSGGDVPLVIIIMLAIQIGGVLGILFGALTGLVAGLASGLVLGVLTGMYFSSSKNMLAYRRMVRNMSILITAILAWNCFLAIMLLYSNSPFNGNRIPFGMVSLIFFVAIPALIAGVTAGLISQIGARWYEGLQALNEAQRDNT